jgi:integrase
MPSLPGRGRADGHLFPRYSRRTFDKAFAKAREAAGLPVEFTAHSLRHIFASVALANGVPITDVSKWLGHRNIQVTYGIYGHLVPSSWDKARAVLDDEYREWSGSE